MRKKKNKEEAREIVHGGKAPPIMRGDRHLLTLLSALPIDCREDVEGLGELIDWAHAAADLIEALEVRISELDDLGLGDVQRCERTTCAKIYDGAEHRACPDCYCP